MVPVLEELMQMVENPSVMKLRIASTFALVLALLVPGTGKAVPVPIPGTSANVELMAQFPDIQTMGGRFVGHYLYTTGTAGLRIYDVSDPLLPKPAGALTIPVFSNEDVDVSVSRKLVLISSDFGGEGVGGLFVVDVMNPMLPKLTGVLPYDTLPADSKGQTFNGVGHIANCILDCQRWAYITGARDGLMLVVDLKDATKPTAAGWFFPTPGGSNKNVAAGIIHDVNTDPSGDIWSTGSGGIARFDVSNPLRPKELATSSKADNDRLDQLVMHNSERLDRRTLLVTEEDWIAPQCNGGNEGSFQTWSIPASGRGRLKPIAQWTTELGEFIDGGTPVAVSCSSHWFDLNRKSKVVADAWYQQGLRFLDVSNPKRIRQVGYYIPPWEVGGLGISQALWVPGNSDLVYGMSLTSGLVVLRVTKGGAGAKTVRAPVLPEWLGPPSFAFAPHPVFGYACAVERIA